MDQKKGIVSQLIANGRYVLTFAVLIAIFLLWAARPEPKQPSAEQQLSAVMTLPTAVPTAQIVLSNALEPQVEAANIVIPFGAGTENIDMTLLINAGFNIFSPSATLQDAVTAIKQQGHALYFETYCYWEAEQQYAVFATSDPDIFPAALTPAAIGHECSTGLVTNEKTATTSYLITPLDMQP